MPRFPPPRWSLKSMFGLTSACAVMAAWLRLRLAVDLEYCWRWTLSTPEGIAFGFYGLWLLQCYGCPKIGKPRVEFLAAAIVFSAFDTVDAMFVSLTAGCCGSPRRLQRIIQCIFNGNAVLGYGFVFSCVLAAIVALPSARASVRSVWLIALVTVVSVNLALLVLIGNAWATCIGSSDGH